MNSDKLQSLRHYVWLTVIYSVVHIFLLLNKSIFWDDWVWVMNPDQYRLVLSELGIVTLKPLFYNLIELSTFQIKFIVFVCYLTAGLFFYESLKLLRVIDIELAFWATVLFMVLPYNILGRSAVVSTIIYSVSFALFFLGVLLYLKFRKAEKNLSKWLFLIFSIVFTSLSFNTTSILPLYIIIILIIELVLKLDLSIKEKIKSLLLPVSFVILHTVIFYFVKTTYFHAFGEYLGYNEIDISSSMIEAWLTQAISIAMMEPIVFSYFGKSISSYPSINMRYLQLLLMWAPVILFYTTKKNRSMYLALAGIALALVGLFPYLAVSKMPNPYEWESRHSLLISLGACLWLVSLVSAASTRRNQTIIGSVLVIFFSLATIRFYLTVQGYRYQDLSLQNYLFKTINPNENAVYALIGTYHPGVSERVWRNYEPQGMVYAKFGTQKNLIIPEVEWNAFKTGQFGLSYSKKYANRTMVRDVKWAEPFYCIVIAERIAMNEFNTAVLLLMEYIYSEDSFEQNLSKFYIYKKQKLYVSSQECKDL